jgi:hypothetical protein
LPPDSLSARRTDHRDPEDARVDLLWFGGIGTYVKAAAKAMPTPATGQ